jgi:hypothetical protein
MLRQAGVVPLLLKRRLLTERQFVDGALYVSDVSRRNTNFRIVPEDGLGFFVKQGIGPEKARTVNHEAFVYRTLHGTAFRNYLPRLCYFDTRRCLLVLTAERSARNLNEHHHVTRRFSTRVAAAVGRSTAVLHSIPLSEFSESQRPRLSIARLPFAFHLHRPDMVLFENASQGCLNFVRLLQEAEELCFRIDLMKREWRDETLIHNDLRWDNCILYWLPHTRQPALMLVDWELARIGDPAWDIGTVLAEYVACWVRSARISGALPLDVVVARAVYPLERMKPAMEAFRLSYKRTRHLPDEAAGRTFLRATQFAGVRLVQTAFERLQRSMTVTAEAVTLMQLALNILQRPQEAGIVLFGMSSNGTHS